MISGFLWGLYTIDASDEEAECVAESAQTFEEDLRQSFYQILMSNWEKAVKQLYEFTKQLNQVSKKCFSDQNVEKAEELSEEYTKILESAELVDILKKNAAEDEKQLQEFVEEAKKAIERKRYKLYAAAVGDIFEVLLEGLPMLKNTDPGMPFGKE